jgi:hypothetical protein
MTTIGPRLLAFVSAGLIGVVGLAACGGGGNSSQQLATAGTADPSAAAGGGAGAAAGSGAGSAAGGAAAAANTPQAREKAFLDYAQCMRDNGVDMKDPTFDANGRPQFGTATNGANDTNGTNGGGGGLFGTQAQRNDPKFQKAQQACRSKLQGIGGFQGQARSNQTPQQQAQFRQDLLAFAQCMRANGVDMKDPTFDANGRPQFGTNGTNGTNATNGGGGRGGLFGSQAQQNDPTYQKAFQACQSKLGNFGFGGRRGGSASTTTTPGA